MIISHGLGPCPLLAELAPQVVGLGLELPVRVSEFLHRDRVEVLGHRAGPGARWTAQLEAAASRVLGAWRKDGPGDKPVSPGFAVTVGPDGRRYSTLHGCGGQAKREDCVTVSMTTGQLNGVPTAVPARRPPALRPPSAHEECGPSRPLSQGGGGGGAHLGG